MFVELLHPYKHSIFEAQRDELTEKVDSVLKTEYEILNFATIFDFNKFTLYKSQTIQNWFYNTVLIVDKCQDLLDNLNINLSQNTNSETINVDSNGKVEVQAVPSKTTLPKVFRDDLLSLFGRQSQMDSRMTSVHEHQTERMEKICIKGDLANLMSPKFNLKNYEKYATEKNK
eukprot:CAMPEP_0116891814 /NCGR_PEP_ID=MMETSP0467-20121206/2151_1 /TAXON_ID=283647 /ORGANISM="Mesodinium pulex, Strain SPMC105" /LENGTH=172 /DNA_ID=CAMNT_0004560547 /DNA_START=769 /DNA_END=1287 /DNA_ORIENTATION=+